MYQPFLTIAEGYLSHSFRLFSKLQEQNLPSAGNKTMPLFLSFLQKETWNVQHCRTVSRVGGSGGLISSYSCGQKKPTYSRCTILCFKLTWTRIRKLMHPLYFLDIRITFKLVLLLWDADFHGLDGIKGFLYEEKLFLASV